MSSRGAQRQNEEAQLRQGWMNAGGTDTDQGYQNELDALKKYYAAQDELRGNWQAGAKSAWADYADSAADAYGSMKSAASSHIRWYQPEYGRYADDRESKLGRFHPFHVVDADADPDEAEPWLAWSVLPRQRWVLLAVVIPDPAAEYEPAGVVHRGEFVFTQEATNRIGVGNLYRMMRGYATGGLVGVSGGGVASPLVSACMRRFRLQQAEDSGQQKEAAMRWENLSSR